MSWELKGVWIVKKKKKKKNFKNTKKQKNHQCLGYANRIQGATGKSSKANKETLDYNQSIEYLHELVLT